MNYAGLRESARELRTESVLLAEEGKYAEAITNQTRGYRLAEHAASDGTLISYLVAVAIDAITTSGMQDILALAGPNADVDAQVEEAVTDKAARLSLRRALSGDVAVADAGFALIRQGGPSALNIFANLTEAAPHPMAATSTPGQRRFFAHLVDAAEADYIPECAPWSASRTQRGRLPPSRRRCGRSAFGRLGAAVCPPALAVAI